MKAYSAILTIATFCLLAASCSLKSSDDLQNSSGSEAEDDYTLAAYYFPNYHPDARNIRLYGPEWTEWELVKEARPRFKGHQQPKVPAWGYTDESDPLQMEQKIRAATDHGLDAFVFDWYYYNDGLFLEDAIEEGFFGARNNDEIDFSLMWANHDWVEIFPADSANLLDADGPDLLYPGKVSLATWDKMTDYLVRTYFTHPSYWLIDQAPYFSIYDISKFIAIFGSMDATKKGVDQFRQKVKVAGFKDLHLNAVVWGETILPSEEIIPQEELEEILTGAGFTSTTSYVWIHHVDPEFPTHTYNDIKEKYFDYADSFSKEMSLPYYPNITMGWDSSPRTNQDEPFRKLTYPYTGIISDNTPANFQQALEDMKDYLDQHPKSQKTFIINCWNEWTEGSYLEPDTINGMAYLEAIDRVFGHEQSKRTTAVNETDSE
ncbi:MAG: hypothetical protein GY790_00440 [Bacteroidetes bacterium]|nr:hypothetical protein [Bacteroidota bacterium]